MPRMLLKCVACGVVGLDSAAGLYMCGNCGATFPVVRGVPRFVGREAYAESFGFEWNQFARTQLDSANGTSESRDTFLQKTGWRLEDLAGKVVLDAGCGMGRFAEVCADAGAEVHAIDLSLAVEAAHGNLGHRPNVHIYQADIMSLPFPEQSFDAIYSIGVLHHTPDTRVAFLKLPPLLKPGGEIAIWVYSSRLRMLLGSQLLRLVTPRLPKKTLLGLSRLGVSFYRLHKIPFLGRVTSVALPTSMHPHPEWRWLDTFDWYSPRFQWKHTYPEVEAWFHEGGLGQVRRGPVAVSVAGKLAPMAGDTRGGVRARPMTR